jgi:hypothetical protein
MIMQYIERFDSRTKLCQFVVENDRSWSVVEVSRKTAALSQEILKQLKQVV